jgi:hypothetical protein
MRRRSGVLVALVLLAGLLGRGNGLLAQGDAANQPPAPADPSTVPGYASDPLSLLGPSRLTASQMAAFVARDHTPHVTVSIEQLAQVYVEEGNALGVRADMAWAQSIVETGFFGFAGSMVHPDDNNFSGIGACDSCDHGTGYATARAGVRAQMQLLRGYADPNPPAGYSIYPPKPYRGSAPTWWQMGNGHWATSTRYATSVIGMYGQMLHFANISLAYSPPPGAALNGAPLLVAGPPPEPDPQPGQGLYLADVQGQVYDVGDAMFWGSAFEATHVETVAIAMLPKADGYWLFLGNGQVLPFGSAKPLGNLHYRIAAATGAPFGQGYWTVTSAGHVRAFGSAARIAPAPGTIPAGAQIVDIAATRTGSGYWLVDSQGHVYGVGDARTFGNLAHPQASDPVVSIAPTPWDDGYWLATASGRVVAFGEATPHGSLADEFADEADRTQFPTEAQRALVGKVLAAQHLVVAVRPSPSGAGYWIVTADGLVIGRGDAPDFAAGHTPGVPVLAVASRLDTAAPYRS